VSRRRRLSSLILAESQSIFCWKYFFRAAFEVFLKVSQSFFPNQIKSKVQGHFPLAYFRWRISVGNFWS
jgi:hypothetical protein